MGLTSSSRSSRPTAQRQLGECVTAERVTCSLSTCNTVRRGKLP